MNFFIIPKLPFSFTTTILHRLRILSLFKPIPIGLFARPRPLARHSRCPSPISSPSSRCRLSFPLPPSIPITGPVAQEDLSSRRRSHSRRRERARGRRGERDPSRRGWKWQEKRERVPLRRVENGRRREKAPYFLVEEMRGRRGEREWSFLRVNMRFYLTWYYLLNHV